MVPDRHRKRRLQPLPVLIVKCIHMSQIVLVLVLDLHACERYQPVGSIDHGLFDPHRSNQKPRTRTTTRTRTIGEAG